MSRRLRYEVLSPDCRIIISSYTLHGDYDDEVLRVLNAMIREAVAICRPSYSSQEGIVVRLVEVDI